MKKPANVNKKSHLYASIATVVTMLLLLLLLWLMVLKVDPPYVEPPGLEIAFAELPEDMPAAGAMAQGYVDDAGGNDHKIPDPPSAQATSTTPTNQVTPPASTAEPAQSPLTQQTESPVKTGPTPEEIAAREAAEAAAAKAKAEAEAKAKAQANANKVGNLFGKQTGIGAGTGTATGGSGGTGIGDGKGAGVKGNPAGHGTSGGNGWSLKGRGLVALPKPNNEFKQEGQVIVQIRVNAAGQVTQVSVSGGNVSDKATIQIALDAARKAKFTAGDGDQIGTITYNFKFN